MGYRSDVKYVLVFPTPEHRAAFIAEAHLSAPQYEDDDLVLNALKDTRDFTKGDYPARIYVHWYDVKWYDSYEWVQHQQALMQLSIKHGGGFAFVRIGEDDTDIETEYDSAESDVYHWDYICLNRITEFVEEA